MLPGLQSKPQLLCWVCCDGVHVDPASGKHFLLGVFNSIKATRFPVVHPRMFWFLTLSDVAPGSHTLRILFGAELEKAHEAIQRKFESRSPLQRINLINEIRNLSFKQAGEYSILIEVDDELLLATGLTVTQ